MVVYLVPEFFSQMIKKYIILRTQFVVISLHHWVTRTTPRSFFSILVNWVEKFFSNDFSYLNRKTVVMSSSTMIPCVSKQLMFHDGPSMVYMLPFAIFLSTHLILWDMKTLTYRSLITRELALSILSPRYFVLYLSNIFSGNHFFPTITILDWSHGFQYFGLSWIEV